MSCKCHQCGSQYKIDISVDDDLWKKIKPPNSENGAGLLCPVCIVRNLQRVLEKELSYAAFELKMILTVDEEKVP